MKYKKGTKIKCIVNRGSGFTKNKEFEILDYDYNDNTYSISNARLVEGWCAPFIEDPKVFVLATITNWKGEFNG